MSTLDKTIFFFGGTFSIRTTIIQFLRAFASLGYQGIGSDYVGEHIQIPHQNPATSLSEEQKAEN